MESKQPSVFKQFQIIQENAKSKKRQKLQTRSQINEIEPLVIFEKKSKSQKYFDYLIHAVQDLEAQQKKLKRV